MTQEEIAKRLGVKQQAVSKWYSGKSLPSQIHLIKLAGLLNQHPDELLNQLLKKYEQIHRPPATRKKS